MGLNNDTCWYADPNMIRLRRTFTVDGDTLEMVKELVSLGVFRKTDNNVNCKIRRRTISGSPISLKETAAKKDSSLHQIYHA